MSEAKKNNDLKDLPSLNALIDKLANHEPTPSEKIVKLAKERDCIYDMIERKKQELEKALESNDKDDIEFLNKSIDALKEQKNVLTKRIKTLLDET